MIRLVIHSERCKACGLCEAHCPKQLLHPSEQTNKAGYHPIAQIEPQDCSGCGICALMCPDICFTIHRVKSAVNLRHERDEAGNCGAGCAAAEEVAT